MINDIENTIINIIGENVYLNQNINISVLSVDDIILNKIILNKIQYEKMSLKSFTVNKSNYILLKEDQNDDILYYISNFDYKYIRNIKSKDLISFKYINQKEIRNLFHLYHSNHIEFNNKHWKHTGRYKDCVNNSSNLYFTNSDALSYIYLANKSCLSFISLIARNQGLDDYSKEYHFNKI